MKFRLYLTEAIKKIPFVKLPKIGWWLDNDPIRLYHGTHKDNLSFIEKMGIIAPTEGATANWVSLALEPHTAHGYASMSGIGGETQFRSAGKKAKLTLPEDRVIIVLDIPKNYVIKNMAAMRGGIQGHFSKTRLVNKEEYDNWNKSDIEYYQLSEVRLPKKVDKKYIKGYMVK